jgi:hypothetical protein
MGRREWVLSIHRGLGNYLSGNSARPKYHVSAMTRLYNRVCLNVHRENILGEQDAS